jgi:endoglucanase
MMTDWYRTNDLETTINRVNRLLPVITTQPAGVTVEEGSNATLTVVATSPFSLSYQWQLFVSGSWVNIGGATSASLVIATSLADDGTVRRCLVSNIVDTVASEPAMVNVTEA